MSKYYVTLGLADGEGRTYKTDDLGLALLYQRNWDEYAEILDCGTDTLTCGQRVPSTVEIKELPKLSYDPMTEEWTKDKSS